MLKLNVKMKYVLSYMILLISYNAAIAQQDSLFHNRTLVKLYGLVDVFYCYDFNRPATAYRQPFFYSYNRHNEFNLNLGLIRFSIDNKKYRGNIALQTGTYPIDNYAEEPDLLKNIFEATAGVSLSDRHNLWVDAGIFASPIGFESAIAFDNRTLTRSILADNSPYYFTGAKVTYIPNDKWMLLAMINNGWQRIKKVEGNSLPSFGTQLQYTPHITTIINWSTFIGTDDPDSTRRMRYFNNFYGIFQVNTKTSITIGIDVGAQQKNKTSSKYNWWYSPVIILHRYLSENWSAAFRVEYYQDKAGVRIPTETTNGFRTAGLSMNLDYKPANNLICRLEGRWLKSKDDQFVKENQLVNDDFFITTSIAVKLE